MAIVSGDFAELETLIGKFDRLANDDSIKALLVDDLAIEYENFMTKCFDESHGPYGEPWANVDKSRESIGGNAQKPLQNTSIMENAIHPASKSASGFEVIVDHPGANIHQYGGTITPKNGKFLVFAGKTTYTETVSKKTGKKRIKKTVGDTVFAKKVVIPARPYAALGDTPAELEARFDAAAINFMDTFFGE